MTDAGTWEAEVIRATRFTWWIAARRSISYGSVQRVESWCVGSERRAWRKARRILRTVSPTPEDKP